MSLPLVSDLIRELCEARSLSRPQLARRSKMARAHLWAVETGKFTPGLPTLEKISEALGVGVARLLSKTEHEMLLEDDFVQKIRPLVRHLNDGHRAAILNTLQAAPKKFPRPKQ